MEELQKVDVNSICNEAGNGKVKNTKFAEITKVYKQKETQPVSLTSVF